MVEHPQGMVLQRLPEPEYAADLTVLEVNEIKARNEEIIFVTEQIKELAVRQQHYSRIQAVLGNEKVAFVRGLCTKKGLSEAEEFNCDLDAGRIMRTAVQVPMSAPELKAVEPEVSVENGEQPVAEPLPE
jgi:hypothetical protein